jgi:hypothetical protein
VHRVRLSRASTPLSFHGRGPTGAGRVLDEGELAAFVRHARPGYRAVVTVLA